MKFEVSLTSDLLYVIQSVDPNTNKVALKSFTKKKLKKCKSSVIQVLQEQGLCKTKVWTIFLDILNLVKGRFFIKPMTGFEYL